MEIAITQADPDEREENVRMIRESAEAVLRDDLRRARDLRFSEREFDPAKLEEFASLGWMMMRVAEADGGLGLGVCELATVVHQLGRVLTPEPVAFAAIAAPALPVDLREQVMNGSTCVLPAFCAYGAAAPTLAGGRLSGRVEAVAMGCSAEAFLIQIGDGAALVRADDAGVTLTPRLMHDGSHLAELSFEEAIAQSICIDGELLREEATLMLSAYLVGVTEAAFEITNAFLKDRIQFDRPIGAFQSLQHRMVDLYLQLALARAAIEHATNQWDDNASRAARERAISLAKAQATGAARLVTRTAIQLHGGIGYTDEADIGLFLRKTMTIGGLLGSEQFHRERAFALMETEA